MLACRNTRAAAIATVTLALSATVAQGATYTVRYGDTLSGIAAAHHIGLVRLARMNHMNPYGVLVTGKRLWVPGATHHHHAAHHHPTHHRHRHHPKRARTNRRPPHLRAGIHTVRRGESLSSIAHRYHSSVRILARVNHRSASQVLLTGTRLWIPLPHRVHHHHAARHVRHHHHRRRTTSWIVRSNPWVVSRIDYWARRYSIDRHLMRAVGWQESGYNPAAVSNVGARGIMQVMPGTWAYTEAHYIGHRVPHTADGGIHVGIAYFRSLLRIFHGNERLSVAAYYQGPGAVESSGIYAGSEFYVRDVLGLSRIL